MEEEANKIYLKLSLKTNMGVTLFCRQYFMWELKEFYFSDSKSH